MQNETPNIIQFSDFAIKARNEKHGASDINSKSDKALNSQKSMDDAVFFSPWKAKSGLNALSATKFQ